MHDVDITPASIDQVQQAANGRSVVIDADVGNIAARLREIHPDLVLVYHEATNHYSVNQRMPDGSEQLVTTALPVDGGADQRLVERVRRCVRPGYDLAGELQKHNDAVDRRREHEMNERAGERAEVAYHRFRRNLQIQNRIFVP